ncbi:DUF1731 domain-containing protein, partial [Parafrankia sp. FMc2]|uniref:DUF1731 domain-containing protein n=1 Tax=Parafrankia sp. FMc2 TaxID=3233196 RepID=UPI0034D66AE6
MTTATSPTQPTTGSSSRLRAVPPARRPAVARVPRAALRLALAAFADERVFASQRLTPAALLGAGFA